MMGAGGFIRNPGWEILSGDDLMDEDYENGIIIENVFTDDEDLDLTSQVILYLSPTEEEMNDDDESGDDDPVDDEVVDDDDEDYVPSEFFGEDVWDDDNATMSSDSAELSE